MDMCKEYYVTVFEILHLLPQLRYVEERLLNSLIIIKLMEECLSRLKQLEEFELNVTNIQAQYAKYSMYKKIITVPKISKMYILLEIRFGLTRFFRCNSEQANMYLH